MFNKYRFANRLKSIKMKTFSMVCTHASPRVYNVRFKLVVLCQGKHVFCLAALQIGSKLEPSRPNLTANYRPIHLHLPLIPHRRCSGPFLAATSLGCKLHIPDGTQSVEWTQTALAIHDNCWRRPTMIAAK